MKLKHDQLEEIVFGKTGFRRFTQDSPILPDVWIAFGDEPRAQLDLLLTPHWGSAPGKLSNDIETRLKEEKGSAPWKKRPREKGDGADIAYNVSTVAVRLYFDEVIRVILPMTDWWNKNILVDEGKNFRKVVNDKAFRDKLAGALARSARQPDTKTGGDKVWDLNRALTDKVWKRKPPVRLEHLVWLMRIVGAIMLAGQSKTRATAGKAKTGNILSDTPGIVNAFAEMMKGLPSTADDDCAQIWGVNINRPAKAMIWKSTTAIKADAARRLFEVKCNEIRWAIIDSGIDAEHPAFRLRNPDGTVVGEPFVLKDKKEDKWTNNTRVAKTFDFTLIRRILSRDKATIQGLPAKLKKRFDVKQRKALQDRLSKGRAIDWEFLSPFLEVPHKGERQYETPVFEHGTHVAGILAADWRVGEEANETKFDIRGVCPDIVLYDLRVLDENGESDEFTILAALQFALYLNASSDSPMLHGVNMSLSIRHKVKNFACGCTPVCEESERLVSAGLVVVAAAGNDGYLESEQSQGLSDGYRSISITDPGNAPGVITVGATHRDSPHTYGVSYFSSRGPTGDGRIKPDLVAPGEKITSTVPDKGLKAMDGTSMAAPHVSGAAALLIARHRELMAKPARIKEILCKTATDLGRERYFQGHGMVDILRAMQSV
jgi:serine protease AprX